MYQIIKDVIALKRYELSDMIKKINTCWLQGDITDEQMKELVGLARENADPIMSVNVIARLDDFDKRLRKIEKGGSTPSNPVEEYPLFQPNHVYIKGDKITFEEKRYECILNEHTDRTTWSPKDYPAYWRAIG